jgi:hypothetical protein
MKTKPEERKEDPMRKLVVVEFLSLDGVIGRRVFASWTLISNPARAPLARSICASPVPAPPPGSSP